MKAVSFLLAALALSLVTVSSQPTAHAADEKADAKKKKKKAEEKAKPPEVKPEEKAKPAEKKPEEKKPDEKAKPAEKKPEEKKPDEKAKPPEASSKPAAPPGLTKPVEPAAVEPEPVAQSLDIETLRSNRGQRRKETVARSRQLWGGLLADERGTAELKRHSFLVSALKRILAIAEGKKDSQTVETVNALLAKEDERHNKKMNALRAGAGGSQ